MIFGFFNIKEIENRIDARIAEIERLSKYNPKGSDFAIKHLRGLKKDFWNKRLK